MSFRRIHGNQNTHLLSRKFNSVKTRVMEDIDAEQICEAIFLLIPEVQRLRELFLCWSLLDSEERTALDSHIHTCVPPQRIQLYRPLKEALRRWEVVQDTQGAPGCEPGMVSFACDPQLEEEIVNVMYILETILGKLRTSKKLIKEIPEKNTTNNYTMIEEVPTIIPRQEFSRENQIRGKEKRPHSVHSNCFPINKQTSMEDISGYKTD
ncbi:hypothetical protein L9F63_003666 [Diploptera punctata]|uniref:Uncharacterized protein n=1 Tax=Diploptera punctata TaxID=6984 RepID=A0AAD7ZKC5_DIPPU|nr:hypothetical protein L9F63_003666 [Diploptera punctata]